MTRAPAFYFGTLVFFLGVVLTAMGFANILAQRFELLILAAFGTGIALMIIGFFVSRGRSTKDANSNSQNS